MAKRTMGSAGAAVVKKQSWKGALAHPAEAPAPAGETISALYKVRRDQRNALREAAFAEATRTGSRVDASRILRHLIDQWIDAGRPMPPESEG